MASAMHARAPSSPPPADASSNAFAAALQARVDPTISTAAPGSISATPSASALLTQLQAGSHSLSIEAMLARTTQIAQPQLASRLTGDVEGIDPQLRSSLERVATQLGRSVEIVSGARTRAEQEVLYQKFLAGTGNLAALPGTSRHESGRAADVYVDGVALADVPGGRAAASAAGLGFPVPGEAWHVEPAS